MKTYCAIDLKSFYASVECVLRGLDPLDTYLVVADEDRSDKTICLAVTPPLKTLGIGGRPRLFEVKEVLKRENAKRYGACFSNSAKIIRSTQNKIECIIAKPRMNTYIKFSSEIYRIYVKYVADKDIYRYSIDEVFLDITEYIKEGNAKEFVSRIINEIFHTLGLSATAGIGSNLYLAKVAMDIIAKRIIPTPLNPSIGMLDEKSYQRELWDYQPLKDFWRVGKGYAKRLESLGIRTMRELAMFAQSYEEKLYEIFGINAELLIDHAWGYEPCTLQDIKNSSSKFESKGIGKVLHRGYRALECQDLIKELVDHLVLGLVASRKKTHQIVLELYYETLKARGKYKGEVSKDEYGRLIPKPSRGSIQIGFDTFSLQVIMKKTLELYWRIVKDECEVRKIVLSFSINKGEWREQEIDLFNYNQIQNEKKEFEREERMQKARLAIMDKFGKNAIHRGSGLEKESLALSLKTRNGGHHG